MKRLIASLFLGLNTVVLAFAQSPPAPLKFDDELAPIQSITSPSSPAATPSPATTGPSPSVPIAPPPAVVAQYGEGQQSSTRNLFLAALAPIAAQSIGHVLTHGLSKFIDWLTQPPQQVANPGGGGSGNRPRVLARDELATPLSTLRMQASSMIHQAGVSGRNTAAPGFLVRFVKTNAAGVPLGDLPVDRLVVQTGDMFYVEVTSNLPGRLVLTNIDAHNETTPLGEYFLEGGFSRRIPENMNIRMTGNPGREKLIVSFIPCALEEQAQTFSRRMELVPREGDAQQSLQSLSRPALSASLMSCSGTAATTSPERRMERVQLERPPVTLDRLPSGAALMVAESSPLPLSGRPPQSLQSLDQVFEFEHVRP